MNDKIKTADHAQNEKKVWRPESAQQVILSDKMLAERTEDGRLKFPEGVYFIAIEELQGAWIDGEWEEADSSETWTETHTDKEGREFTRTITKDIPRSRRYVLKRFTPTGFAENAFSGSYSGSRKYK